MMNDVIITLRDKNMSHTLFSKGVKASVVWERQMGGRRRIQTGTLAYNFFFTWPYHAVLSSRPHLALLLLDRGYSTGGQAPLGPALAGAFRDWENLFWPQAETHASRISRGHHISFHKIHTFPFKHVIASAYFYRCVLCRESDWRLGQESIYNLSIYD